MKILVADDDRIFSELTCAQLRQAGFQTAIAFDGMQAIMLAKKNEFAAIILDINMPGGSGFEALKLLKASNRTNQVPVIIVTSTLDAATKAKAVTMGAVGIFGKPLILPELLECVKKFAHVITSQDGRSASPMQASTASKALVRTVLVVDDDRVLTKIVSTWLSQLGYATLTAHSVPEALKLMTTRNITAVILDLDMPVVRGTALIRQLKSFNRTSSVRIIVLSGSSDPGEAKDLLAEGVDDFLEKPADFEAIKRSLATQFTRSMDIEPLLTLAR